MVTFPRQKVVAAKTYAFSTPAHLLLALHQLPDHGQQHCFELVPHEAVDEEVCRRIHNQEQVHETAGSRLMRMKNGKDSPCQAKEPTRRHEAITPEFFCVRVRILLQRYSYILMLLVQRNSVQFMINLEISSWSSLQRLFQIKLNLGK